MTITLKSFSPTLQSGDYFYSPGCNHRYRVIGAVCLLYDREQLPHPCCSLEWRGKQPSWRRDENGVGIGKRFVRDFGAKGREVYSVWLEGYENREQLYFVFTYWKMSEELEFWWHGTRKKQDSTKVKK